MQELNLRRNKLDLALIWQVSVTRSLTQTEFQTSLTELFYSTLTTS